MAWDEIEPADHLVGAVERKRSGMKGPSLRSVGWQPGFGRFGDWRWSRRHGGFAGPRITFSTSWCFRRVSTGGV